MDFESLKQSQSNFDQITKALETKLAPEDQSNKKLYEFLKSRKQDNIGISDLKDKNNILTSDPLKKANLIHEVFNSVFSNPSPKISANFDEKDRLPTLKPINVTLIGILKLLKSLNPNKANGPDSVPGIFLKLCWWL